MPSSNPADRPFVSRLPVVLVALNATSLDAARATAVLAGLDVVDGWHLAPDPWDVTPLGVAVLDRFDDEASESDLVDAVARGAGAIVGIDRDRSGVSRLLDAIMRTAPMLDWIDCPLMTLEPDQLQLLHALADGTSVRAAARMLHLSERTVHRRIADARRTLDIESTNEAAAEVDAVVRVWREGVTPPAGS